jgi:hypothetical protein
MAQSTFRRRGTGSSRSGVEQSDGSLVDSGRPCTSAVGARLLAVSMLGLLVATGAVSKGDTVAHAAGEPSSEPVATQPVEHRNTAPVRTDTNTDTSTDTSPDTNPDTSKNRSTAGSTDRAARENDPVADNAVETIRQRRLAHSLIYAGGAALAIAGSGLLLVGARRRLW